MYTWDNGEIQKTETIKQRELKKLLVLCQGKYLSLPICDIAYFSKHRQGSEAHLCPDSRFFQAEYSLIYPRSLKELTDLLQPYHFSLSHNHYLVHLSYVSSISLKTDTIRIGQECLPLARFRQQDFLHDFSEYRKKTR